MEPDEDIGEWAERVAGRGGGDPAADALRRAVRAEDSAAATEGAADAVGLARLLRRLEAEALLEGRSLGARPRRLSRPWIALAAAAGIAAVAITVQFALPGRDVGEPAPGAPPPTGETARGFAGAVRLTVADPEAEVAAVITQLQAIGLTPRRLPRPDRVILEVDVSDAKLGPFRAWAEPKGARVGGAGTWRVIIDPAGP